MLVPICFHSVWVLYDNQKKEQIAAKLDDAGEDDLPEKSKAKGV
jgi:hypothetical protein